MAQAAVAVAVIDRPILEQIAKMGKPRSGTSRYPPAANVGWETIVQGYGKPAGIEGRVKVIRAQIEASTSDDDEEKLQERLAKLVGGMAGHYGAADQIQGWVPGNGGPPFVFVREGHASDQQDFLTAVSATSPSEASESQLCR
jgi:hypothetical protein